MGDNIFLMLKDTPILEFNMENGYYRIMEPSLLPYLLRDRMVDTGKDYSSITEQLRDIQKDYNALMTYFSRRTLSVGRENAKGILNELGIEQKDDFKTNLAICFLCRGMSLSDDYWIRKDERERWADINVRSNPLHEAIAQIALYGKSLTITGDIRTPELTGQGAYAKAWFRENGELYLYKAGSKGGNESEVECMVSKILDCTNVPHITYTLADKEEKVNLSRCKCMTTDKLSIVEAGDVSSWCACCDKDFEKFVKNVDADLFYKMVVVDYLIANRDRHSGNWGFYVKSGTGEIIGMHPLFDHNNAFDKELMEDKTGGKCLVMHDKTQQEAAHYAIKRCDFRITKPIKRDYFLTEEMYQCFMERACELDIMHGQKQRFMDKLKKIPFEPYAAAKIEKDNSNEYFSRIQTLLMTKTESKKDISMENIPIDKPLQGQNREKQICCISEIQEESEEELER